MEISLQFKDGRVCNSSAWTNGCSVGKMCVEAAAILARNRQISEIEKINMMTIMDQIGQLPETHLHCAQLAETNLKQEKTTRCPDENALLTLDENVSVSISPDI